jgi:excisionase family DNA binding protein
MDEAAESLNAEIPSASRASEPLADLTVEDVGRELNRAPSTIRGWLGSGSLRGYRLNGREWRIPRQALKEFLEAQRSEPPPPAAKSAVRKRAGAAADLTSFRAYVRN